MEETSLKMREILQSSLSRPTHSISKPASRMSLAVPPLPRSLKPSCLSSLAKGKRPVLS